MAEVKRLAVIVFASLALWATDFLHGFRPGWIALAAAVVAMLPRVGAVMIETGLSVAIGNMALGLFPLEPGADATNFAVLSLISTFAGLITTNPSQPALLAPLVGHFAEATGWPLKTALLTMAVGFSTVILPYQVPPVVIGLQVAQLSVRTAIRVTVPLALLSIVTLIPLNYLWWRAIIGYFGN